MGVVKNRRKGRGSDVRSVATRSAVLRLSCGQVMTKAHKMNDSASVYDVLVVMTRKDWDHLFIVSDEGLPIGRIHAVDVLKLSVRKTVNRNLTWMMATPAMQMVNLPPLQVNARTPLLKAGALMLTHDLNQLAVVDDEGVLIGAVSHSTMARNLPRFIL